MPSTSNCLGNLKKMYVGYVGYVGGGGGGGRVGLPC